MTLISPKPRPVSLADFEEMLADKPPEEKGELLGGRVIRMMAGAALNHHRIVQNISSAMLAHFRRTGSPCRPFNETFFLKSKAFDLAALPDVMVRCGPLDGTARSLDDPAVAIEVVSPGSEERDIIEKYGLYTRLPSLRHYALAWRDQPRIRLFSRRGPDWVQSPDLEEAEAVLRFEAVDFQMPLSAVYEDIAA